MISKFFAETLEYFGIQGKQLHEITGISQNHISEFKRGKGNISVNIMWKLIDGMDELAPGARAYFCSKLIGERQAKVSTAQKLEHLIEVADTDDLSFALSTIAKRYREMAQISKNTESKKTA